MNLPTKDKPSTLVYTLYKITSERGQPLYKGQNAGSPLFGGFTVQFSQVLLCVYQVGQENTLSNVLLELLSQILKEPCFDALRTKEQLGTLLRRSVLTADT